MNENKNENENEPPFVPIRSWTQSFIFSNVRPTKVANIKLHSFMLKLDDKSQVGLRVNQFRRINPEYMNPNGSHIIEVRYEVEDVVGLGDAITYPNRLSTAASPEQKIVSRPLIDDEMKFIRSVYKNAILEPVDGKPQFRVYSQVVKPFVVDYTGVMNDTKGDVLAAAMILKRPRLLIKHLLR